MQLSGRGAIFLGAIVLEPTLLYKQSVHWYHFINNYFSDRMKRLIIVTIVVLTGSDGETIDACKVSDNKNVVRKNREKHSIKKK